MRAVRMVTHQHPAQVVDVAEPEPGPGEVLVKIGGAGVCHSDLHVLEAPAELLPYRLPFTLGHENAGWVAALGDGVTGLAEGDPVAVYGPWGCGRCRTCAQGKENYCERAAEIGAAGGGLGLDGGMAAYLKVPDARLLVPLPAGLEPKDAAPLTDAGLTPYHAIKAALPLLVPGSTAVVIGVGGLGHLAVQLLRALSPATVVAVDTAEDKLGHARELGAHQALLSDETTAGAVRDMTGGLGAELVLDMVGADPTLALAAAMARNEGRVTIVGLAGGALPVGFGRQAHEVSVSVPYWGSRSELMEVLALGAAGSITPTVNHFGLEDGPEVYRKLEAGQLRGRAVLVP